MSGRVLGRGIEMSRACVCLVRLVVDHCSAGCGRCRTGRCQSDGALWTQPLQGGGNATAASQLRGTFCTLVQALGCTESRRVRSRLITSVWWSRSAACAPEASPRACLAACRRLGEGPGTAARTREVWREYDEVQVAVRCSTSRCKSLFLDVDGSPVDGTV